MDLSSYKTISINGTPMKKILIGGVVAWVRPIVNWVRKSINADGTIYNGTGYKNGYRVRSGGAEATTKYASVSGYIKVNAGDIIRISGFDFSAARSENAINVSDSNLVNIGQLALNADGYGIFAYDGGYYAYAKQSIVQEKTGVWRWIVPPAASKVAYIRLTGYTDPDGYGGKGDKMILTINEEI